MANVTRFVQLYRGNREESLMMGVGSKELRKVHHERGSFPMLPDQQSIKPIK